MLSILSGFKRKRLAKRAAYLEALPERVKRLSDDELKAWYIQADAGAMCGGNDGPDAAITENELNRRGFRHMYDY